MGSEHSRSSGTERPHDLLSNGLPREHAEIEALREENQQLRELVIQLSKIIVRNVVERK